MILCQCEDAVLHEARCSTRARGIPGWHETGNWAIVAQRRPAFIPWTGADVLAVDASTSIEDNMKAVRKFVTGEREATVDRAPQAPSPCLRVPQAKGDPLFVRLV